MKPLIFVAALVFAVLVAGHSWAGDDDSEWIENCDNNNAFVDGC